MSTIPKPISKFSIFFTFILLSLFTFSIIVAGSDEESDDLEQLLAVDEQLQYDLHEHHQSEAETVSKAQRIVLELNGDNTKRLIYENEFVMVLGYAPWCARSADLMPKFSEAATDLKEMSSPILMAKIDGDRYSKIATEIEIKGFPTLLLFVNGSSQAYTGGSSSEDIVIWVQKKIGAPLIRVETVDEAQRFVKKYHTFVLGLFERVLNMVSSLKLRNQTSDIGVAKLLFPEVKTNNVSIGMVKTEAERYTAYDGSYKMEKRLEFISNNKFPLITKLNEANTVWVYSSPVKLQVMVFSKADDFQKLAQSLEHFARKFKSKLMFMYLDITNENLAMPFLTLFGIEVANETVVFWNLNECLVPRGVDPRKIGPYMKRFVESYGYMGPLTITAIGVLTDFPDSILRGLYSGHMDISNHITLFTETDPPQANIISISEPDPGLSSWFGHINKCPFPPSSDARLVGPSIKRFLETSGYSGPLTITAVGVLTEVPIDILRGVCSSGIALVNVPYGSGDIRVLRSVFAKNNPPPANFAIISDLDSDFPPLPRYGQLLLPSLPTDVGEPDDDKCSETGECSCHVCSAGYLGHSFQNFEDFATHLASRAHQRRMLDYVPRNVRVSGQLRT